MTDITGKQLLHRYILKVAKDAPSEGTENELQMDIIVSFYRNRVDPAYRSLVANLIEDGLFDDFIKIPHLNP